MARWRLLAKHYLNVPGGEWEYKETNRDTGKQARKVFVVPTYLDPDNGGDCNYPGELIVAQGKGIQSRDIVFEGPPTPDMEPLDEEAQAISDKERPKWVHPIESLPGQGNSYGDALLEKLTEQLAAAMKANPPVNVSAKTVSVEAFERLQADMKKLMETNAHLMANQPKSVTEMKKV